MKSAHEDSELLRELANLPREVSPRTDVWTRISVRITSDQVNRPPATSGVRVWQLATAASFLFVVAAGLLLGIQRQPAETSAPAPETAQVMAPFREAAHYSGAPSAGELEYQAALREFMALNAASAASYDSAPNSIEQGWETLHQIELEVTAAIHEEPDNEFLKSRLGLLRSRQIELLRQLAATDNISWRKNI